MLLTKEKFEALFSALLCNDVERKIKAAKILSTAAKEDSTRVGALVIEIGAIPGILSCLTYPKADFQESVLGILVNLSFSTLNNIVRRKLIECGVLPSIVGFAQGALEGKAQKRAVGILNNLAQDPENKNPIGETVALATLARGLISEDAGTMESAACALWRLVTDNPANQGRVVSQRLLPLLQQSIERISVRSDQDARLTIQYLNAAIAACQSCAQFRGSLPAKVDTFSAQPFFIDQNWQRVLRTRMDTDRLNECRSIERAKIMENPAHAEYYRAIQTYFSSLMAAALGIASDYVRIEQGNEAQVINWLSLAITAVFPPAAIVALPGSAAISFVDKKLREEFLAKIRVFGVTMTEAEVLGEQVARLLVRAHIHANRDDFFFSKQAKLDAKAIILAIVKAEPPIPHDGQAAERLVKAILGENCCIEPLVISLPDHGSMMDDRILPQVEAQFIQQATASPLLVTQPIPVLIPEPSAPPLPESVNQLSQLMGNRYFVPHGFLAAPLTNGLNNDGRLPPKEKKESGYKNG